MHGCINFTKFSKLSSVSFRRFIYLPEYQVLLGIVTAILRYNKIKKLITFGNLCWHTLYKVDRRTVCLDDFDVEAIRHLVHDFYREKKYPTLDSLLLAVKEKGLFGGERATLWIILHKMGFKHKKVNDKRYIYEQPSIIYQRHAYLQRMRVNRREGRPVVYLDETWANARDGKENMWVGDDPRASGGTKGGIRKPSGKGSRLIILHAGGESG